MNSKQLMQSVLNGKQTETIPVTPHWWGLYKFQLANMISGYEEEKKAWDLSAEELAEVDKLFYETYKPDMFHLTTGPLQIMTDKEYKESVEELKELSSKTVIDDFVKRISLTEEQVIKGGIYDHVEILNKEYGDEVFITVNEGNPIGYVLDPHGYVGFEEGLIALIENPEMMEYLIYSLYDAALPRMKALKDKGAHGYIGSEVLCSSDLISPAIYRDIIFPAQKHFYTSIEKMGLTPISYFLGDINPLMEDINKLGIRGLLVEESKKGFNLDVLEIRKKLSGDIALFGNLDSVYTLLDGNEASVVQETLRQLEAAKYGPFVMANGCPVAFNTPEENIKAMIKTTREFQLNDVK
jgi:uroporphyrinogen-III decarboxylase